MQYEVADRAAAAFSTRLYRELLQTQPLDYAVARARQELWERGESRDWAAPVLYMNTESGMIYER